MQAFIIRLGNYYLHRTSLPALNKPSSSSPPPPPPPPPPPLSRCTPENHAPRWGNVQNKKKKRESPHISAPFAALFHFSFCFGFIYFCSTAAQVAAVKGGKKGLVQLTTEDSALAFVLNKLLLSNTICRISFTVWKAVWKAAITLKPILNSFFLLCTQLRRCAWLFTSPPPHPFTGRTTIISLPYRFFFSLKPNFSYFFNPPTTFFFNPTYFFSFNPQT